MIILKKDFAAKKISISPAVEDKAGDSKEHITYDLEIDDSYWDPGIAVSHLLPELPAWHSIPANTCILVKTRQVLQIPDDVFGVIASKAKLTTIGLIVANIKIDPNFHGALIVCLFNASNKPIQIQKNMRFCSIYFQGIHGPLNDTTLRNPPDIKASGNSDRVEFFYANKELILGAAIIFGVVISLAGLIVSIIALVKGVHAAAGN